MNRAPLENLIIMHLPVAWYIQKAVCTLYFLGLAPYT